ncbi:ARM REPEAT PROTEIN INTERACTING WITH ABF2 [Tetrabaena socialis]|uniref:ARM REPEAT PROTEIN INTERACTING WITH ABF2 n=1 Tax=Tetrabaena socialis TaxID=47790 RepID=A0A2J8A9A1_9CHLO|nr:ARM REPEAT PROTEIN INTERACTING WITH ABF2 [Tetrabaena socialis]|eukprot:PNH09114.1 ARM REPEAT PROTEIN INTERACTING WITH ABF2 [Tetrabaena socialis]
MVGAGRTCEDELRLGCEPKLRGWLTCGCDSAATQTLVSCGDGLRPLRGADSHGGLELGPPLQLFAEPDVFRDVPPAAPRQLFVPQGDLGLISPTWDPYSSAVYMVQGGAVLRLGGDDTVAVVAGDVNTRGHVDGPGGVARFDFTAASLASDGAGALYVADEGRIRKLQLPPAEAGAAQGAWMLAAAGPGPDPAAAVAAAVANQVVVSTLPLQLPPGAHLGSLVFHGDGSTEVGCGGSLMYATRSALYRLPLDANAAAAAPVLLAGVEGVLGAVDGRGPDARFFQVTGLAVDGEGAVWVADIDASLTATAVRRVAADGTVTTVVARVDGCCWRPVILRDPNGCLACFSQNTLFLLYLSLKPPPSCCIAPAPAPPAGLPPRTLPADFGALLDRQPDGTADVTILVGGRTFHAHRLILLVRSDYFRQRLAGGFADGCLQELSLPDADPDAFKLILWFIYTGVVADIPGAQAQALVELADRLLLPELCQLALAVVEAGVSACTVVGMLLWAEACSPAFSELLSRLKAWYVEHTVAVLEEAPDAVERLAEQRPALMVELTRDYVRTSKRSRTG